MLEKISIEIKTEFVKHDGDGSPCTACEEPVYGKMFVLTNTVNNITTATETRFCESCYELVKPNE